MYEGTAIGFRELRRMVIRMANVLHDMGIQKGDRVGLHMPNCPQYTIAYYASLSLGAIVVNLNPAYPEEELSVIIADTGLSALFTIDEAAPVIGEVSRENPIPRIIVTNRNEYAEKKSAGISIELTEGWYSFTELLSCCTNETRPRVQVEPKDPAVIQYTGGTTGVPKGAVLTHANLVAAVMQVSPRMFPIMQFIPPERRFRAHNHSALSCVWKPDIKLVALQLRDSDSGAPVSAGRCGRSA